MMTPDYILDVNESDFEYEVVAYSQNIPVVVDFWASWCRPCKEISAILVKLAHEARGTFRLARVNVDESPNLALRFSVRTLPTIKIFSSGEITAEVVGAQPEFRLREILSRIQPPSPAALAVEKADSILSDHDWPTAETLFREILENDPDNAEGLLGLSKSLLGQGKAREAMLILETFPASRQYAQAEKLRPFAKDLVRFAQRSGDTDSELDAAYWNCIRLAGRGRIPAALDGLLDVLRQDKHYARGQAHQVILSLLELMGDTDPLTRQYRSELASILF